MLFFSMLNESFVVLQGTNYDGVWPSSKIQTSVPIEFSINVTGHLFDEMDL